MAPCNYRTESEYESFRFPFENSKRWCSGSRSKIQCLGPSVPFRSGLSILRLIKPATPWTNFFRLTLPKLSTLIWLRLHPFWGFSAICNQYSSTNTKNYPVPIVPPKVVSTFGGTIVPFPVPFLLPRPVPFLFAKSRNAVLEGCSFIIWLWFKK